MKKTAYSMSHQVATLGRFGGLVPTMIQEVAPGDTWSGKTGTLIRFSPLKHAIVQDIYVDQFSFFVPHRLVSADWEDFIAEGPMDAPTYTLPVTSVAAGDSNYECLFWRANAVSSTDYCALRHYAYWLVYNEFFRDEAVQGVVAPSAAIGKYGTEVNYKREYWTELRDDYGSAQADHYFDTNIGSGTQASAKDVLEAIARQKVALKRETYGSRYIDILRSYGVNISTSVLQRPEVVGISRNSVNITDVVSTDSVGLGDLGGHGISGSRLNMRRKTFNEHGTLMSFCVVRPPFQDGGAVDYFDRVRDYTAFYDPSLVALPPTKVERQDVKPSMDAASRQNTLGYWNWGDWYRKSVSKVHEALAANDWVGSVGLADGGFTLQNVLEITSGNYDAIFSDTTFGHFQISCVHKYRALRKIPKANIATGLPAGASG